MKRLIILLCICLLLSSCVKPTSDEETSLSVVIVEPVNGTQYYLGDIVDVHISPIYPGGEMSTTLLANEKILVSSGFPAHPTGNIIDAWLPWTPEEPGEYIIQVIIDNKGQSAASNLVTIIVQDGFTPLVDIEIDTETPTPEIPTETPTPTSTTTPTQTTPTLTPTDEQVTATTNMIINCRYGPNQVFGIVDTLQEGLTVPILGRTEDSIWYLIESKVYLENCWLWIGGITINGNPNSIEVVEAPSLPDTDTPTPTITPTPTQVFSACSDYPDIGTCNTDPMGFGGCSWDTSLGCKP